MKGKKKVKTMKVKVKVEGMKGKTRLDVKERVKEE